MNWFVRRRGRDWFVVPSLGEADDLPPSYVGDSEARFWITADTEFDALEEAKRSYDAWQKQEVFG